MEILCIVTLFFNDNLALFTAIMKWIFYTNIKNVKKIYIYIHITNNNNEKSYIKKVKKYI